MRGRTPVPMTPARRNVLSRSTSLPGTTHNSPSGGRRQHFRYVPRILRSSRRRRSRQVDSRVYRPVNCRVKKMRKTMSFHDLSQHEDLQNDVRNWKVCQLTSLLNDGLVLVVPQPRSDCVTSINDDFTRQTDQHTILVSLSSRTVVSSDQSIDDIQTTSTTSHNILSSEDILTCVHLGSRPVTTTAVVTKPYRSGLLASRAPQQSSPLQMPTPLSHTLQSCKPTNDEHVYSPQDDNFLTPASRIPKQCDSTINSKTLDLSLVKILKGGQGKPSTAISKPPKRGNKLRSNRRKKITYKTDTQNDSSTDDQSDEHCCMSRLRRQDTIPLEETKSVASDADEVLMDLDFDLSSEDKENLDDDFFSFAHIKSWSIFRQPYFNDDFERPCSASERTGADNLPSTYNNWSSTNDYRGLTYPSSETCCGVCGTMLELFPLPDWSELKSGYNTDYHYHNTSHRHVFCPECNCERGV